MARIPKETIEKIFDAARIEEVVGDYVQLKRSGSNLKGLSPFNNERSPSFYVSPAKGIFKDFSSGKGGNVVTFLMEREHFTYPEALRYLAKKYNIDIQEEEETPEQQAESNERESLYLVSQFAQKWFQEALLKTDEGRAIGYSYFQQRGISDASIEKFGLGFSPPGRDAFCKAALKSGYVAQYIEQSGLGVGREGQLFDRFRDRVIFPIYSLSGRVLGFGGRILRSDVKAAKYLNSPESLIYHKSKVLYGLFQAKSAIIKQDKCYLVEGYTDVISFAQSGIENVVSASGTALRADQISLIKRLTPNITMLFDGDAAGIRAAMRGIDLVLEAGMKLRVVALPDGADPDSFAREHGAEGTKSFLEANEVDFITFKTQILLKEAGNDPIKKAALIKDIVESIAKIPDPILREVYVRQTSVEFKIDEQVVFSEMSRAMGRQERAQQPAPGLQVVQSPQMEPEAAPPVPPSKHGPQERAIVKLLVAHAALPGQYTFYDSTGAPQETEEMPTGLFLLTEILREQELFTIENPRYKALFDLVVEYFTTHDQFPEEKYWLQHPDNQIAELCADLVADHYRIGKWEKWDIYVPEPIQHIVKEATQAILHFKREKVVAAMQALGAAMEKEIPAEEMIVHMQQIAALNKARLTFDNLLHRVV
jgi:DNA primase